MHKTLCSFSNLSVTSLTSQLILQPYRRFTYVTAHSPTLPFLHLRQSSLSNPSFASPTSQALHLIHLASRPWNLLHRRGSNHGPTEPEAGMLVSYTICNGKSKFRRKICSKMLIIGMVLFDSSSLQYVMLVNMPICLSLSQPMKMRMVDKWFECDSLIGWAMARVPFVFDR